MLLRWAGYLPGKAAKPPVYAKRNAGSCGSGPDHREERAAQKRPQWANRPRQHSKPTVARCRRSSRARNRCVLARENFYYRSDHYNFARKGVPVLFFFNGVHPQYHRPSDTVDLIDAEKESRIVRMVFYIGLEVANAAQRPQWNPESRRRIVEAGGN